MQSVSWCTPVSREDEPGSSGAVHLSLQVVLQPLVLFGALPEHMFSAHEHKVNWSILKSIPVYIYNNYNNEDICIYGEDSKLGNTFKADSV